MPWGPPSLSTKSLLILTTILLSSTPTTPKLTVIPAVPGVYTDDIDVVLIENTTTLVVYTPAPIHIDTATTFCPVGSFVSIASATQQEDLLAAALEATAAPPRLVANTTQDDVRHPLAFDLLFVHQPSQLHIWRPQPLENRWFPLGDLVTVGNGKPDPSRVWLVNAACMGEFPAYSTMQGDTKCNTVTVGRIAGFGSMTMVRACEAQGDQLGALGTMWLGKQDPCAHVVPVYCAKPSGMVVPGRSNSLDTSADRWCIHGMHRVVRLCQSLIEGTHTALNVAGGSVIKETLGSFDVKHEGIVLRRGLQHRLRGCFVAAHQLFSANYAQKCSDLQSVKDYMHMHFQNTFELELVLNVTEVASNAQLLRWPLNQGYLKPPLATNVEEPLDDLPVFGNDSGLQHGGDDDDEYGAGHPSNKDVR